MYELFHRLFPGEVTVDHHFAEQIQSHLPATGRVLDLGCGDNSLLNPYRSPALEIWGVDFQEHPRLQHRDLFRLLPADGRIPFAAESFDVMTSSWVLEHVHAPRTFLREVARVLRPGGAFISRSISAAHYVTWITRLLHVLPHRVTQEIIWRLYRRPCHDTFPTWYRLNSEPALCSASRSAGLQVTGLYRAANPDYFSFSPALLKLATLTDWVLEKILPGLGRIYFVAVMRKPGERETIRGIVKAQASGQAPLAA
jgi:2-polyprenyl-3-methyl-5-hydroxy-6-metoxy-1,4-benzoquinol methylase